MSARPNAGGRAGRIIGLDIARAIAMAGMFIAHFGPATADLAVRERWPYQVVRFTDGRAMPLFVVLSGAGFALLVRRPPVLSRVLPRAAILLLAGLWLEGGLVLVILHFYALYFLVGLLIYRLPDWTWLVLAALTTAIGAASTLYLTEHPPESYKIVGDSWWSALPHLAHPKLLGSHLVFTGEYRIFPSFAFFLVGMWLARRDLSSSRVQAVLMAGGLTLAVIGYGIGWSTDDRRSGRFPTTASRWWLLSANGHSQMPVWMLAATATALAVIGACLWLGQHMSRAVLPFASAGQLALTFYIVHVFLIRRPLREWPYGVSAYQAIAVIAGAYLAFVAAAFGWRRFFAYGPAEAVLRIGDRRN